MPSRKQEIYREFLQSMLPYFRSVQYLRCWNLRYKRNLYVLSEFVHNICHSILDPDFVEHDIWFLNHQARWYCENAGDDSPFLQANRDLLREIFLLVPSELRHKLDWNGP